jgi:hypothetical protein
MVSDIANVILFYLEARRDYIEVYGYGKIYMRLSTYSDPHLGKCVYGSGELEVAKYDSDHSRHPLLACCNSI